MPVQNPLSIPGGWKKDTPRDTPAGEEPDPVESQTIPRTPAGVVSETGGILDDAGREIGKVTESEDGQSLVGNTVTATGDVVDKTSGDVLGRASLESDDSAKNDEYTTTTGQKQQQEEEEPQQQEQQEQQPQDDDVQSRKSGSGIFGTLKSGLGYASSLGGKSRKSDAAAGSEVPASEAPKAEKLDAENVQDTAKDAASEAPSVAQDTPQADDQSQAPADDLPAKDGAISLDDREKEDDNANDDSTEKAGKDEGDDSKTDVPESTVGDNKSQADLGVEQKGDEAQEALSKKGDEAEEGLDEAKSQANLDDTKSQANLDDVKSQVSPDESASQVNLGDTKSQANLGESESQANLGDAKSQANLDETEQEGKDLGSQVPEEAQSKLDDTQSKAEGAAEEGADAAKDAPSEVPEDAQSKLDDTQSKAEGAAEEGADAAKDAPSEVPEDAQSKLDDTQSKLDDTQSKAGDAAEEGADAAKDAAPEDATPEVPEDAQSKLDDTQSKAEETAEEGADAAKDAAAVGEGEDQPQEGEQEEEAEGQKLDYSILKGCKVNKVGNVVDDNGNVVGRIVDGDPKKLQGKRSDEEGKIWNDSGKVVGQAEPLPDDEREDKKKSFAPFENFPDAVVEADGRVVSEGRQVGTVVEGDPKRLKGSKVDEDGDILDRNGNTVGRAEAWDEPEPIPEEPEEVVDRSILAGKRVNKAGNVVDSAGTIFGKVVEGNVSSIVGRMCDKEGNIRSESGDIIGRAELVPEGEREGSKEGPFAELSGLTVRKDGMVVTPSDEVVGRLISGDGKKLSGRSVDEDGDVVDKNGNVLGKAERYEEPEEVVEEKKRGPLYGRKVNKEGNVVDEDGNVIAKLVSGDVLVCAGKEIDDDGDVMNSKGNTVGHVALLSDIPEPEPEPEEEEVETEEEKKAREQAEADRKLAGQLSNCIEQSLEKIKPICKLITDKIDKAERTPKEELDEEQLVREVKPLIEEGGKILSETNGVIRGLDPDGRIQRQAKQKSGSKDASPEEYHLAEVLKDLTGGVTQTVDNAKRKIDGMPHAKKELNPLWGLLMEPLGQILAAVGLLLTGVLGLVGRLLSGLGLGGIVDGLLGGLGLNKILGSLGLGAAYDALVGKKKK